MQNIFLLSLIYLIILLMIIFVSVKFDFTDNPNSRKLYQKKILNTAGISIYIYFFLISLFNEYSLHIDKIIFTGIIILICGFLDDRKKINSITKLLFIILSSYLLISDGMILNNLGYYNFIGLVDLGKFGLIFTLLATGLLINSYNYIDGIDGLLISIIQSALIYIAFIVTDEKTLSLIIAISIPLMITLIFNMQTQFNSLKIFLGDCGSLFLGYFMSFFIIHLYINENIHPSYLIWICWLPIYDFLFVTIYRIKQNKNFYIADNIHLHHIFFNMFNKSHSITTLIITIIYNIFIYTGYMISRYMGDIFSLGLFTFLFIFYFFIRYKNLSTHKKQRL